MLRRINLKIHYMKKGKSLTNTYSLYTNCTYKYNLYVFKITQSNNTYYCRYINM